MNNKITYEQALAQRRMILKISWMNFFQGVVDAIVVVAWFFDWAMLTAIAALFIGICIAALIFYKTGAGLKGNIREMLEVVLRLFLMLPAPLLYANQYGKGFLSGPIPLGIAIGAALLAFVNTLPFLALVSTSLSKALSGYILKEELAFWNHMADQAQKGEG